MAQPSSSHHDRRERGERERSHHHHRTISSTTLLLTLSLILAVLAVMLSLPSSRSSNPVDPETGSPGLLGIFSPKRGQALVSRESAVAQREAEVAKREAEILVGVPGGVTPTPLACAPCPTVTEIIETFRAAPPVQTIFTPATPDAVATPGWSQEFSRRIEEILEREAKIAERERDISRREETVNRREHDAARREGWIMEQLVTLGNDPTVEEEYIYEPGGKRKLKELPYLNYPPPPVARTVTQTYYHTTETSTATETVTLPAPANTRAPLPQPGTMSPTSSVPPTGPTRVVELLVNEEESRPRTVVRTRPRNWFGAW